MKKTFPGLLIAVAALLLGIANGQSDDLRFVILGDRTGEAVPGAYEQVWKEAAAENPAFLLSVGDTIEGLSDARADAQWQEIARLWTTVRLPLYLTPGNHDIWSPQSEALFRKYARRAPHYSFDQGAAHFTILDNSRTEELTAGEMTFLEADLQAHQAQRWKLVVMHRPSWLINVMLENPRFPLHQMAKKYGVQYVIAGHVHRMIHVDLEGITYVSMPSSGGHLRASGVYEDGWFFGHGLVTLRGAQKSMQIRETSVPFGKARVTLLEAWGRAGLSAH